MIDLFFNVCSRSFDSAERILFRFSNSFTTCEISFSDNVKFERNLYPLGEMLSSDGFSSISLAIESSSKSPSKVKLSSLVFALFSGRFCIELHQTNTLNPFDVV